VTLKEARAALGLAGRVTEADVRRAYRERVVDVHPDHGGNPADFIRVRAAYEILLDNMDAPFEAEEELTVPADLQAIIDRLVADFRKQTQDATQRANQAIDNLQTRALRKLGDSTRHDLTMFDDYFRNEWNATISRVFGAINADCERVMGRYSQWVCSASEEALKKDKDSRDARTRMTRRAVGGGLIAVLAVVVAMILARSANGVDMRELEIRLAVAGFLFLCALYFLSLAVPRDANGPRRMDNTPKPIQETGLRIGTEHDFKADNRIHEHDRHEGLVDAAVLLGAGTTWVASGGILGPLATGVAVGWGGRILTSIPDGVNRILRPTGGIKKALETEVREFIELNRASVVAAIVEGNERVANGLERRVTDHYQQQMRATILMLRSG
jgi:DnaJ domain